MFAIVSIAGTQERVEKGMKLHVPHLDSEEGKTVTCDDVLLLSDGDKLTLGTPAVSGASVTLKVLGHGKADKIRVAKMHRRKRYRRVHGHRQHFSEVEVVDIKTGK